MARSRCHLRLQIQRCEAISIDPTATESRRPKSAPPAKGALGPSADPTPPSDYYWIASGGGEPQQVYCDMTVEGGGWTRCYEAAKGSLGAETWAMPGNSCFGVSGSSGELLIRGSGSTTQYIVARGVDSTSYESWCLSTDLIQGVGLDRPVETTVSFWGGTACALGGDNDTAGRTFYSWSHDCGADVTIAIGRAKGNGCDYHTYALGDLWVFYR